MIRFLKLQYNPVILFRLYAPLFQEHSGNAGVPVIQYFTVAEIKLINRAQLCFCQTEIPDILILPHMLRNTAPRHHAHAPVNIPAKRGLRCRFSVFHPGLFKDFIGKNIFQSFTQRRPCLRLYAQLFHNPQGVVLMIERMQLHLIDHGRHCTVQTQVGQPLRTEVAHTNGSDLSIFIEFLKGAPRTVIVAVWLVNEIQIDIVKLQYARSLLMQEESMIEQIREYDRKKRTISVGSCTPVLIPDFVSLLSSLYEGMTISTEVTGEPHLAEQLRENKYQLVIFHEEPDAEDFYSLPIESEHLYVLLPPVHPLADADGLYLKDLDGQTFLLYSQIGFWDGLCRRKMPSSRFLLQQEMDVLGELVENSAFPAFTTDYVMKRSRQETDRVIIPILDEEANVTYYCACLKSEKARFMPVFRHFR